MANAPNYGPSSTSMERDARQIHADKPVSPGSIAIGVVIGRTSEFFDFFVYGLASVLVFPQLVFPFAPDRLTATLYSFAIFSLAFLARPVGSVVFMTIDRLYGRGTKLTIALFLLGGSTASIAFLPGYNEIGVWSIALLALFRLGQGFALGGAWDGLASLLALNAPKNHRGWYAMIPQLGAPIGFALASLLFGYFVANLSPEDFLSWGWRYPFFVAFAINVVALFARLRLVMTTEFGTALEQHELEAAPIRDVIRVHGRDILIGAFVPLASFAMFHLVTIFPLGWMSLYGDQPIGAFMLVQTVGAMVGILTIIASGLMADRIGRRGQLAVCAVLIAIFSFVGPIMLGSGLQWPRCLRHYRLWRSRPFLRPGNRLDIVALRPGIPLHRRRVYLGSCLAGRRRVRAACRAQPLQPLRPDLRRLLPAVGCDLYAGCPGFQQGA
jgi:MFS family permease